jgi:uncharacterized protein (UPF0548 family)
MTFSFRRPTEDVIQALLARQADQPWSYDWPEITRGDPAPRQGWQIDRHRVLLGHGEEAFRAACRAICEWRMFPTQMCEVYRLKTLKGSGVFGGERLSMMDDPAPPKTPDPHAFDPLALPRPGEVVAVLYRSYVFRLWMLFPARVVYAVEEAARGVREHPDRIAIERESNAIGRLTPPARLSRFGFAYGTLPDHPERGEERFIVEWNHADDSVWYDLLAFSRPCHWLARLGYPYARYEQARFRRQSGQAMQAAVRGRESLACIGRPPG